MVELVDTQDLKSCCSDAVRVRVPPSALFDKLRVFSGFGEAREEDEKFILREIEGSRSLGTSAKQN